MINHKYIAIIEPSLIVREGLKLILSELPEVKTIFDGSDVESLSLTNENKKIDLLIINPAFFNKSDKKNFPDEHPILKSNCIVALVYSYINIQSLSQFSDVLYIDDNKVIIQNKIKKLITDTTEESPEVANQAGLSDREKEILISLTKGKANKEIADEHCISIHTVISHRKNITRKTGIRSVSGLTVYALLNKLIDYSDI